MKKERKILVVIGGGAAGFFCAVNAAGMNPELKVVIVEKSNKLLSKVRVSGGGRCNVTHACFEISSLVKKYPRGTSFLKKSFHQFNANHCVQWFQERGVELKTEADGRMFSITDTSQTIIDCLLKEANKYEVEVLMNSEVKVIASQQESKSNTSTNTQEYLSDIPHSEIEARSENTSSFLLELGNGEQLRADYVCVACGGYPKSSMFEWLTRLGHSIELPVPSLFTFNIPDNPIIQLMGVAVEKAQIKVIGSKLSSDGPLLITHWGMSGPAILKLSAWGAREFADQNYHFTILVNWLPAYTEQALRNEWQDIRDRLAAQKIGNRNPFSLPNRLWSHLLAVSGVNETIRWADLPGKEQNRLMKNLVANEFVVNGKTTFKEEFVTCGGIKLGEVNANTMESKLVPNLYFAGEIMDVDGITGGFNFQHAWTSGWIAARSVGELNPAVISKP